MPMKCGALLRFVDSPPSTFTPTSIDVRKTLFTLDRSINQLANLNRKHETHLVDSGCDHRTARVSLRCNPSTHVNQVETRPPNRFPSGLASFGRAT